MGEHGQEGTTGAEAPPTSASNPNQPGCSSDGRQSSSQVQQGCIHGNGAAPEQQGTSEEPSRLGETLTSRLIPLPVNNQIFLLEEIKHENTLIQRLWEGRNRNFLSRNLWSMNLQSRNL